jgi:hypothetical protein
MDSEWGTKCHTREGGYEPINKIVCVCVMCHDGCLVDRTIPQCGAQKKSDSNFCQHCEDLHGDAYRAKYGGSK